MENEVTDHKRKVSRISRRADKNTISTSSCKDPDKDMTAIDMYSADKKNFEDDLIFMLVLESKKRIMTCSEKTVMEKLLDGYKIQDIADELDVSKQYIYNVRQRIRKKLKNII